MKRIFRRLQEMYGRPARKPEHESQKPQSIWFFISAYLVQALALAGFGHWAGQNHPIIRPFADALALLVLFRGFLPWCSKPLKLGVLYTIGFAAIFVIGWYDCIWMIGEWTPSYIYFVPTKQLFLCEKRAFFVNHSGPKGLQNLHIVIKDETSGIVQENDEFRAGIEPGPQNPDAPQYIWVKPSRPWHESYSIIVTGTNYRSQQETILAGAKKDAGYAVKIILDSKSKPVVECRDQLVPEGYPLSRDSKKNCDELMEIDPRVLDNFEAKSTGFQAPDGGYRVIDLRKLPPPTDLDASSDDRHLTEYQQRIMTSKLSKYRGTKLLILYTGGAKTLKYATELRNLFVHIGWRVEGLNPVPAGDEGVVDVQVSISNQYWAKPYVRALDLRSSLEGLKHRDRINYDDAIQRDLIVLWVGPKSPDSINPDDCAAAEFRPASGTLHNCGMVAQTSAMCPFVP
jgi:hypothetical protein